MAEHDQMRDQVQAARWAIYEAENQWFDLCENDIPILSTIHDVKIEIEMTQSALDMLRDAVNVAEREALSDSRWDFLTGGNK